MLNPQKRMKHLETLKSVSMEDQRSAKRAFIELFDEYNDVIVSEKPVISANKSNSIDSFFEKTEESEEGEVEGYLQSHHQYSDDFDVIAWWKLNARRYPVLARMARDFLCIQASSAPSERIFSGGVDLLPPTRASLNSESIMACMCLKNWLKLQNVGIISEILVKTTDIESD